MNIIKIIVILIKAYYIVRFYVRALIFYMVESIKRMFRFDLSHCYGIVNQNAVSAEMICNDLVVVCGGIWDTSMDITTLITNTPLINYIYGENNTHTIRINAIVKNHDSDINQNNTLIVRVEVDTKGMNCKYSFVLYAIEGEETPAPKVIKWTRANLMNVPNQVVFLNSRDDMNGQSTMRKIKMLHLKIDSSTNIKHSVVMVRTERITHETILTGQLAIIDGSLMIVRAVVFNNNRSKAVMTLEMLNSMGTGHKLRVW